MPPGDSSAHLFVPSLLPQQLATGHLSAVSPPCQGSTLPPCNYAILEVILTTVFILKQPTRSPLAGTKKILTSPDSLSNMPGEIKRC